MDLLSRSPRVAVLILNFNGERFLLDCFRSVIEDEYASKEIYLIDNHSSDRSVELTRALFPSVEIIENESNLLYAAAYDRVIRGLDHDYAVLLNNDTIVRRGWLQSLVQAAESDEQVAACGSKLLAMWDNSMVDHAGGLFTWVGSGLDLQKWKKNNSTDEPPRETGFACGASLLLRRKCYLEVGGFDTSYGMYHEDVDLCWRLRLAGHRVMTVPSSVVYHFGGGAMAQGVDNHAVKVHFCQKNRLANLVKNMGAHRVPFAIGVSCAYDVLRAARLLCLGREDIIRAILRGYGDTLTGIRQLIRKRRVVQSLRVSTDTELAPFFADLPSSVLAFRHMARVQDSRSAEYASLQPKGNVSCSFSTRTEGKTP